jgi:prepilin-type N-terminal cleavage/methylation domain-containing protein
MKHRNSSNWTYQSGFTTIELLIVVAIGLVVATIAVPAITTTIANVRMRSSMSSLSGHLQNTRMLAVKENKVKTARFTVDRDGLIAYTKNALDGSDLTASDAQVQLEAPIQKLNVPTGGGAPAALTSTFLGYTPSASNPSFNARGLPCLYTGGLCPSRGFAYYFKDTRRSNAEGWSAITISPAGRITKWFWNGSEWVN